MAPSKSAKYPQGPFRLRRNQRLPKEVYEQRDTLCFFTVCAQPHQAAITDGELAGMILKTILEDRLRLGILVLTYCLMPDHLHLLLKPKRDGCSMLTFVDQTKGKTTNRSWKLGRRETLWQRRSYDHVLESDDEFPNVVRYIIENPVREGLVERPQDYPWSGGIDEWSSWHIGIAYQEWERWCRAQIE